MTLECAALKHTQNISTHYFIERFINFNALKNNGLTDLSDIKELILYRIQLNESAHPKALKCVQE